jgi:hypothetical protein
MRRDCLASVDCDFVGGSTLAFVLRVALAGRELNIASPSCLRPTNRGVHSRFAFSLSNTCPFPRKRFSAHGLPRLDRASVFFASKKSDWGATVNNPKQKIKQSALHLLVSDDDELVSLTDSESCRYQLVVVEFLL